MAQLYIFFQEVHMHALLMLDAAAQDIETAQEIKASLIKECDLEKGDAELIDLADRESIRLWKTTTASSFFETFCAFFFKKWLLSIACFCNRSRLARTV